MTPSLGAGYLLETRMKSIMLENDTFVHYSKWQLLVCITSSLCNLRIPLVFSARGEVGHRDISSNTGQICHKNKNEERGG